MNHESTCSKLKKNQQKAHICFDLPDKIRQTNMTKLHFYCQWAMNKNRVRNRHREKEIHVKCKHMFSIEM